MSDDKWTFVGIAAFLATVIAIIAWFVVRDQNHKTECRRSGGIVAQAEHGDGWSCVHP